MMHTREFDEYERLTEGMEIRFSALTFDFLFHCENIIFGIEYTDLKYFCFHLYNCDVTHDIYERFTFAIEKCNKEIDVRHFPDLSNGFVNLLIYLREPKARETDLQYLQESTAYWRSMVIEADELRHNNRFWKYLKKKSQY